MVEWAGLENRYTLKGIGGSNPPTSVMSGEQIKFRPNEQESEREWQEKIARRFEIGHDAEHFIIPITRKDGTKETHYVSKHAGQTPRAFELKSLADATLEEAIRAIQEIFPTMDKPNMKEAILILRQGKKADK